MHIVLLFNPISGAGRARRAVGELVDALKADGHEVRIIETQRGPSHRWLAPRLPGVELLVIVGGDGAVRAASGPAAQTDTPLYHYPCGTENLFAREWSMTRSPVTLRRAIERRRLRRLDLGRANAEPFLLMASVGFDAEVVHDLSSRRAGSIRHSTYAAPILRQLRRWEPPRLTVDVDGRRVATEEPGFVVVANCRQYGWRFDPAPQADMTDGQLDVVFFPTSSRLGLLGWIVRTRLRRHGRHPRLVGARGGSVRIASRRAFRFQLDGDEPDGPGLVRELDVQIVPAAVPVLVP